MAMSSSKRMILAAVMLLVGTAAIFTIVDGSEPRGSNPQPLQHEGDLALVTELGHAVQADGKRAKVRGFVSASKLDNMFFVELSSGLVIHVTVDEQNVKNILPKGSSAALLGKVVEVIGRVYKPHPPGTPVAITGPYLEEIQSVKILGAPPHHQEKPSQDHCQTSR